MPRDKHIMAKNEKKTKIKTFRLHADTIKDLNDLTKKINNRLNIKLSMNGLVEFLIRRAAKEDIEKIINVIVKT